MLQFEWNSVHARLLAAEEALQKGFQPSPGQLEKIFRERAIRLARVQEEWSRPTGEPFIVFRVEGERYSLPLKGVVEVAPCGDITQIPGLPKHIAGVLGLRGEIYPILDLRVLLEIPTSTSPGRSFLLMLQGRGRKAGVQADVVEGTERIVIEESQALEASRFVAGRSDSGGSRLRLEEIMAVLEGDS